MFFRPVFFEVNYYVVELEKNCLRQSLKFTALFSNFVEQRSISNFLPFTK